MTLPAVPTSLAALARTTQILWWLVFFSGVSTFVLWPAPMMAAEGVVLWVVRGFLTLGFVIGATFVWRFTTWVGRVGRGAVSTVDVRRVAAWLRFWQVAGILGVLLSIYELGALLVLPPEAAARVTKLTPLDEIGNLLNGVFSVGLSWTARRWVLASAPAAAGTTASGMLAAVRSMQPWVRAVQVLTVPALIKALWQPGPVPVIPLLLGFIVYFVLLEFSLRFAWASAQEPPVRMVEPSTV